MAKKKIAWREDVMYLIKCYQYKLPIAKVLAATRCSVDEYELLITFNAIQRPPWVVVEGNYKINDYIDLLLKVYNPSYEDYEIAELAGTTIEAVNWRMMQADKTKYRENESDILYKHNEHKLSPKQIAKALHCSEKMVRKTLTRHNLVPNPPRLVEYLEFTLTDKERAKLEGTDKRSMVLKYHAEGWDNRAIAKQVECDTTYVSFILRKADLKPNKVAKQSKTLSRWQEYRKNDTDIRDIIVDCIARGDFSNGVENGINCICVGMGVSKKIVTPIAMELLSNVPRD